MDRVTAFGIAGSGFARNGNQRSVSGGATLRSTVQRLDNFYKSMEHKGGLLSEGKKGVARIQRASANMTSRASQYAQNVGAGLVSTTYNKKRNGAKSSTELRDLRSAEKDLRALGFDTYLHDSQGGFSNTNSREYLDVFQRFPYSKGTYRGFSSKRNYAVRFDSNYVKRALSFRLLPGSV